MKYWDLNKYSDIFGTYFISEAKIEVVFGNVTSQIVCELCSRSTQQELCLPLFLKGAVCNFLNVLMHNNTIICLQIFRKCYVDSANNNAKASYSTLKCGFSVRMSIFLMVCVTPPIAILPIGNLTPQVCQLTESTEYCKHGSQQTNWVRAHRFPTEPRMDCSVHFNH